MEHRLYRSVRHRVIGGVCGGIADHFGWDPFLVRVVFILFAHTFSVIYLILLFVLPNDPRG